MNTISAGFSAILRHIYGKGLNNWKLTYIMSDN